MPKKRHHYSFKRKIPFFDYLVLLGIFSITQIKIFIKYFYAKKQRLKKAVFLLYVIPTKGAKRPRGVNLLKNKAL